MIASRRRSTQSRGLELEFLVEPVREGMGKVHLELSVRQIRGWAILVPHLVELHQLGASLFPVSSAFLERRHGLWGNPNPGT